MKKGPSRYSRRDITKGRSTLSWQQQMWRKNSNGHTPGQERNLKGGLVSKSMFRSWTVLVSRWLLEAKVIIVQNQTQTLKAGPLDLLTNTWIELRLEKWKFHKQSQGLRGPAHGTCILLREAPGFQKSRNVCRETRQKHSRWCQLEPSLFYSRFIARRLAPRRWLNLTRFRCNRKQITNCAAPRLGFILGCGQGSVSPETAVKWKARIRQLADLNWTE